MREKMEKVADDILNTNSVPIELEEMYTSKMPPNFRKLYGGSLSNSCSRCAYKSETGGDEWFCNRYYFGMDWKYSSISVCDSFEPVD